MATHRVIVRDAAGKVIFDDSVVFLPRDKQFTSTGVIKVPDADPELGFRESSCPRPRST